MSTDFTNTLVAPAPDAGQDIHAGKPGIGIGAVNRGLITLCAAAVRRACGPADLLPGLAHHSRADREGGL